MTLTLLSIISAIGVATMQRVYLIRSLSHWHDDDTNILTRLCKSL